jgi:hypothetical protein
MMTKKISRCVVENPMSFSCQVEPILIGEVRPARKALNINP